MGGGCVCAKLCLPQSSLWPLWSMPSHIQNTFTPSHISKKSYPITVSFQSSESYYQLKSQILYRNHLNQIWVKLSICEPMKLKKQVISSKTTMVGTGLGCQLQTFWFKKEENRKKESQVPKNFKNQPGEHDQVCFFLKI